MENPAQWYNNLIRPAWAPPRWVFGPAWTILYILIAISFTSVGVMFFKKHIPFIVVLPFVLNLILNGIFTYLQMVLKNNLLASIDIILLIITIIWAMVAIFPFAKWISYIQIPYLLWLVFAGALQISITYLNW